MISVYLTALLSLFLPGLQSTEPQPILTCVSPGSFKATQLTCPSSDYNIWVKEAYLARTLSATPSSFCDPTPTLDPARSDCLSSVDDVTNDANSKCALYANCQLIVDYTLLKCNATYVGFTYLYVAYECLPITMSGVTLPSFILSDSRTASNQPSLSYFRSNGYASYGSQRGACRLLVPANTRATWRLFDLRGRLINLATGCSFLLQIYTSSVYRQWCAELAWEPEQFDVVTSSNVEVFNLNFYPQYGQNSEGKVWLSLSLTNSSGNPVNIINITCGQDIALNTPPTTTLSAVSITTTTTTLPPSTSVSSTTTTSSSTSTTTTLTTTTPTSPTTSSTTTSPTTPSYPSTTSSFSLSSFSFAQTLSSQAPAHLSTPGIPISFSTPLDASRPSIETENGTTKEYNGTEALTTLTSSKNKADYTVWLIIGLTVGGGLLLLIFIIVAIAAFGYRKRRNNAQRQGDVIFAWERAATGGTPSGGNNDKTTSVAKPKVNTYCRGPPTSPDIYHEIFTTNPDSRTMGNVSMERSTGTEAPPPLRSDHINYQGQPRVSVRQPERNMSEDVQMNPVYGHLSLANYILPIDGVQETAAI